VLARFAEKPGRIQSLLDTKRTGLATSEFEELVARCDYNILMYAYRFRVKPRTQAEWITTRKSLRDFVTTCAYYTLTPQ
jgi:hypothetical protein